MLSECKGANTDVVDVLTASLTGHVNCIKENSSLNTTRARSQVVGKAKIKAKQAKMAIDSLFVVGICTKTHFDVRAQSRALEAVKPTLLLIVNHVQAPWY